MMIWVRGRSSFSRMVHSMPEMPGSNTSMRTTSGREAETNRSASSPDSQAQTHLKSGKESIRRDQLSRIFCSSSTRATRNGKWPADGVGMIEVLRFMPGSQPDRLTLALQKVHPLNRGQWLADGPAGRSGSLDEKDATV